MDLANGKRKIFYISTFIPKGKRTEILSNQKIFDNNSGDVLSFSIFKGLASHLKNELRCINIAPVGPFPKCNKEYKFKGYDEIIDDVEITSISFSTIFLYQHHSIYRNLLLYLKGVIDPKCNTTFIVYSILEPALHVLSKLKDEGYKIKIITIVPDFWDDMLSRRTIRNHLKKFMLGDISKYYRYCDAFILLTDEMKDKIPVQRPYRVIEGMYDSNERRPKPYLKKSNVKTIFYSGMIHEKFGIKDLVDAFRKINNPNIRLRICGSGDYASQLRELEKSDNRITYLGLLSREDVLNEQYNANVLVNPRKAEGEFTKYSFPSKTIEYLASGTPTLIHKLPGIPNEYYRHCLVFKSEEQDDIIAGLLNAVNLTNEDAYNMGLDAQQFINKEKNAFVQCKKIIELINIINNA